MFSYSPFPLSSKDKKKEGCPKQPSFLFVLFLLLLSAEVVKCHILIRYSEVIEKFQHCIVHQWWSTEVIIDLFGFFHLTQVLIIQNLVYKPCIPIPLVFRQGFRKCKVKVKVGILLFYGPEFILIENLPSGACTIPVSNFSILFKGMEEMENMRSQRSHTCTTSDIYHFVLGFFNMEITERP